MTGSWPGWLPRCSLEGLIELADGVAHVDRGAGQLDGAAEEFLRVRRQHEPALEPLARAGSGMVERGVDAPLRGLAFAEPEPAGRDVGEVGDEGRPADLDVALVTPG